MANTYELITATTLGSSASSITLSSIPATYDNLLVKINARSTAAVAFSLGYLEVNGSAGTAYFETYLIGNNLTPNGGNFGSQPFIGYFRIPGASGTNNTYTFSNCEVVMPSYATSKYKTFIITDIAENNNTSTSWITYEGGLWVNTSAISSIKFGIDGAGLLETNSSIYLYGIKNT